MNFSFVRATSMLFFGAIVSMVMHFLAFQYSDWRLTALGYLIAVNTGIYYGLKVGLK